MPLAKGSSQKVIGENIAELIRSGKYSREQAIAIAFSQAREARKKKRKDSQSSMRKGIRPEDGGES